MKAGKQQSVDCHSPDFNYSISSADRNTSPANSFYAFPRLSTPNSQIKDVNAAKAVNP